jgi:putative flippase GtrA
MKALRAPDTGAITLKSIWAAEKVRYLVIGGYNTVFGLGIFILADTLLGDAINYVIIAVACNVVAIFNAYIVYRFIVFRVRGNFIRDGLRFSTVYLGALAVNLVLLPALVETTGLDPRIAQSFLVLVTICFSYFGHKYFSFRRPEDRRPTDPVR